MADVARPALAEVLAALADSTRDRAPVDLDYVKRAIVPPRITIRDGKVYAPAESGMSGWYLRTDSTAEAVEALATVRLWPWEPGDERAPRWWCENCGGSGTCGESWKRSFVKRCSACRDASCGRCGGRGFTVEGDGSNAWDADAVLCTGCNGRSSLGHTADPPSHAALVAVASLGRPLLQRCVALADVIAHAAGCPDARVVWRVMGRKALHRHHEVTARDGDGWGCVYVSSHEHERARRPQSFGGQPAWPNACPWPSLAQVDAAWPALRTLAVGDGETPQPTGVHLVALDASRIALAVEAIGGPRG